MTITLKYLGDEPLHEELITGSKRIWNYGQTQAVPTAIGTILSTTGLFEQNAPVVELTEHAAEHAAMGGFIQPVVAGSSIGGGGFAKHVLVAGAAAGDVTVTGIKVGDELNEVLCYVGAGVAVTDISDLTNEFTVAAGKINNATGTSSTGSKLLVRWTKKTT